MIPLVEKIQEGSAVSIYRAPSVPDFLYSQMFKIRERRVENVSLLTSGRRYRQLFKWFRGASLPLVMQYFCDRVGCTKTGLHIDDPWCLRLVLLFFVYFVETDISLHYCSRTSGLIQMVVKGV